MELIDTQPTTLSKLKDRFDEVKYDPTMLFRSTLETVDEITNGEAVVLNATSPFAMLLEMSATHTASAVHACLASLREAYPQLAVTEDELYTHMCDEDYLNRFTNPDRAVFTIAIQYQSILTYAVMDPVEKVKKLIIPRDSRFTIDSATWMTLYPITIRLDGNNGLQFAYDPEIHNPIYALKNTMLDFRSRTSTEGEVWIFIDVEMVQVNVKSVQWPIVKTYRFLKDVTIGDHYCYARAYYRGISTNEHWKEIKTTHTEQVFDATDPTVLLKVVDGSVRVEIPIVYLTSGTMTGDLRVDVYTTRGAISMNLSNYKADDYDILLTAIDEERDISKYSEAMADVSYQVFSNAQSSGGTIPLSFEKLRERVIYNSIGPQNIPITDSQMTANGENNGFDIVKDVDVLTKRLFLATKRLPAPSNANLITPANIGIQTYVTYIEDLSKYKNVIRNGNRLTIRSKALWLSENGILKLLSDTDIVALYAMGLTNMVYHLNTHTYFYTPFYYVLDETGDEFDVRAYALDQPKAADLNFIRQNQTANLFVNTGSFELLKKDYGYDLRIVTNSGNFYKALNDSEVGCQIAFNPKSETTCAYINGVFEGLTEQKERIFLFKIETNHDLNDEDLLKITNSNVQGIIDYQAWIDLKIEFNILHYTTSIATNFIPDKTDLLLGKFLLPTGSVGLTHETLDLTFGYALNSLWRRCRSYQVDTVYHRHPNNVPLTYSETVYENNGDSSPFFINTDGEVEYYPVLHAIGDPVFDEQGDPVYKHKAGDPILDQDGEPIKDAQIQIGREFDLLVIDARYFIANDNANIAYRDEIDRVLTDWIVEDLAALQQNLLDETKVYFYPRTTLGNVLIEAEQGEQIYLPSEQSFSVSLHVLRAVYDDKSLRDALKRTTIQILDDHVSRSVVNLSEMRLDMRKAFGNSVHALRINGIGGDMDYELISVVNPQNKLCLKKELVIQPDNTMIMTDAVEVQFKLYIPL